MKKSTKAGLAVVITIAVALLSGVGLIFYNHHLSPLAKLRESVAIGEDFESVSTRFKSYEQDHKGDEIQLNNGVVQNGNPEGMPAGTKFLHLYHWVFMDDLQLTVFFDRNNKVCKVAFIGD